MKKFNVVALDPVTKILLIVLIGLVFYFSIVSFLKPFFITEPVSVGTAVQQVVQQDILNFSRQQSSTMNLIALIIAVGIMTLVSYFIFRHAPLASTQVPKHVEERDEYAILCKALSDDEKAVLDEVHKTGEITQDSLRFRLEWSKAKISTILTRLDKMGLIQRERVGKTYKVYPQQSKK